MSNDRLVLLGTKGGPSIRTIERMPTSSLLEIGGKKIVVDCGLGVARGVVAAGVQLADIDSIFITHLHSDHVIELGPLLHTAWTSGLRTEIDVFGPVGTREYLDGFYQSLKFDIDLRIRDEGRNDIRELAKLHQFGEGSVIEGELAVNALRVVHPPVDECYALSFEAGGWKVTFSSDTNYFPPLIEFAKDSDILVHEAMLSKGIDRLVAQTKNASRLREHLLASHTDVADAAKIAESANVRHLVLHHLVPVGVGDFGHSEWLADAGGYTKGQISVGEDGMEIRRSKS